MENEDELGDCGIFGCCSEVDPGADVDWGSDEFREWDGWESSGDGVGGRGVSAALISVGVGVAALSRGEVTGVGDGTLTGGASTMVASFFSTPS